MSSCAPVKLYYFDASGRAEAARLALHLGHIPFEDVRFSKEDAAQYKSKSPTGLFPFLEFPDGTVLVESSAILLYAAKVGSADLLPEDPVTFGAVMMMIQVMEGVFNNFSSQMAGVVDEEAKQKLYEGFGNTFPLECEKLYTLYRQFAPKTDGKYLFGDKPTIADLHISAVLGTLLSGKSPVKNVSKESMDKVPPKFLTVLQHLSEIPEIKEYQSNH